VSTTRARVVLIVHVSVELIRFGKETEAAKRVGSSIGYRC
jgi:hypothetical protein